MGTSEPEDSLTTRRIEKRCSPLCRPCKQTRQITHVGLNIRLKSTFGRCPDRNVAFKLLKRTQRTQRTPRTQGHQENKPKIFVDALTSISIRRDLI